MVVGRPSTTAPLSWRAQASPTRPEQPSLASVGGGMAAGAPRSRTLERPTGRSVPSDLLLTQPGAGVPDILYRVYIGSYVHFIFSPGKFQVPYFMCALANFTEIS